MFYVTMTDPFMSGWGQARGLINKLVFLCETWGEVEIVYANAVARKDMKHIHKCCAKPKYYRSTQGSDYTVRNYYVQNKTKEEYSSWYVKDYFKES